MPRNPDRQFIDVVEQRLQQVLIDDDKALCALFARIIDSYIGYSLVPMPRRPRMDDALDNVLTRISLGRQ